MGNDSKKLLKKDLKAGQVIRQALNGLCYKGGAGEIYKLIKPYSKEPRVFTSFIPECKGDNDEWYEELGIFGKDCDVWVFEKWWVTDSEGNPQLKDVSGFLSKWSTAVRTYANIVKTISLEEGGYFEEVI